MNVFSMCCLQITAKSNFGWQKKKMVSFTHITLYCNCICTSCSQRGVTSKAHILQKISCSYRTTLKFVKYVIYSYMIATQSPILILFFPLNFFSQIQMDYESFTRMPTAYRIFYTNLYLMEKIFKIKLTHQVDTIRIFSLGFQYEKNQIYYLLRTVSIFLQSLITSTFG